MGSRYRRFQTAGVQCGATCVLCLRDPEEQTKNPGIGGKRDAGIDGARRQQWWPESKKDDLRQDVTTVTA